MIADNRVSRQSRAQRLDHGLDDGVVFQHEMHAFGAEHGVGGRRGHGDPKFRQRLRLLRSTIPDRDAIPTRSGCFDEP